MLGWLLFVYQNIWNTSKGGKKKNTNGLALNKKKQFLVQSFCGLIETNWSAIINFIQKSMKKYLRWSWKEPACLVRPTHKAERIDQSSLNYLNLIFKKNYARKCCHCSASFSRKRTKPCSGSNYITYQKTFTPCNLNV